MTVVVADTGDLEAIKKYHPRDATEVVMPDRRLVRAWFFNKKLIEDDSELYRVHDLSGDLGRGGTIDKLFESVVLMPEKGVAEKAAIRRILREFVGEFAWILKDEIGPLLQHGYPFGVEKSLQVHDAIRFKCGDFGDGDVSDKRHVTFLCFGRVYSASFKCF